MGVSAEVVNGRVSLHRIRPEGDTSPDVFLIYDNARSTGRWYISMFGNASYTQYYSQLYLKPLPRSKTETI